MKRNSASAVAKRKQYRWKISRIKVSPAAFVGVVYAPDEKSAVKAAIAEFKITKPEHQKRLITRRISSKI